MKTSLPNAFPNAIFQSQRVHGLGLKEPAKTTPAEPFTFKPVKAGTKGYHCFLVLDESGSMSNFTNDTIGGVNTFIQKQIEDNDDTKITIIKFEGGNIRVPVDGVNVKEVGTFKDYAPLGGTNLLDAVGHTLQKVNEMLSKKSKKRDRPSVFIQIVTDGHENQSRRFIKEQIQGMVSMCEKADWIISYVGANVDAFHEASGLGISAAATSGYSTSNISQTYNSMASSITRMKSLRATGATTSEIYAMDAVYNVDERKKMGE